MDDKTEKMPENKRRGEKMNPARTRNRRSTLKIVAALALCAALVLSLSSCGADTKGQTEETFGEAFYSSEIARNGAFQSDYVNESGYSVTSYTCSNIRGGENGTVNADVEATIENDSFQTALKVTGAYSEDGGYRFDIAESKTTPKKGIDFDKENGLEDCESELTQGSNGPLCTVRVNPSEGYWFLDRMAQGEYAFTDGVGWQCKSFDSKPVFNKELEGAYARVPKESESNDFPFDDGDYLITGYTISNFDPDAMTFDVEYSITGNFDDKATISGKATAKIEEEDRGSMDAETLNVTHWKGYSFKGEGTSNAGDGTATVSGKIDVSADGERVITAHVLASGNGPEGKYARWPCSTPDETMKKQ